MAQRTETTDTQLGRRRQLSGGIRENETLLAYVADETEALVADANRLRVGQIGETRIVFGATTTEDA